MAAVSSSNFPKKRELPKLIACITKNSLTNMRNKELYNLQVLDARALRRRKLPLHECLILELNEAGFHEAADYIQDLLYDNMQLVAEDDIGIVVDLSKRPDYLEDISSNLQQAEKYRERGSVKQEALCLLHLALDYSEKGRGILWLAEKFFMASIAVASQHFVDGGRQKGCCKYHYAKFLLDKFPGGDLDEPFQILTEVRDSAIGKTWPLYEPADEKEKSELSTDTLFKVTALQLHRVLIQQARMIHKADPSHAETLARLAERRAVDAEDKNKTADAIIEMGICQLALNNLNNARKTFERAYKIHTENSNIEGICDSKMHLAAVLQRLGEHEKSAKELTEMGALAMEHGLKWHLGHALHLIGELHLRNGMPELGTPYLHEAFTCFLGFSSEKSEESPRSGSEVSVKAKKKAHVDDAEQSRLMMSISSGQEKMASYFHVLKEAKGCAIAKMKIMEWKLSNAPWWVPKQQHNFLPCPCSEHHRTPLDVLRYKQEQDKKLLESKSKEDWPSKNPSINTANA